MLKRYTLALRVWLLLFFGLVLAGANAFVGRVTAGSERFAARPGQTGQQQVGKVPDLVQTASFQNYLPSSQRMDLLIHFQNRDDAGLKDLTRQLHDRSSAKYHQWVTPDEFGKQFGRSDEELSTAQDWLKSQGFQIDRAYPNSLAIGFSGTVDVVERAFNIRMGSFLDAANNRSFFSNLQAPILPPQIQGMTLSLDGLNNAYLPHSASAHNKPPPAPGRRSNKKRGARPQGVPGNPNFMSPTDLAIAYGYKSLHDSNLLGQGQKVAIIALSDVLDSDIAQFRSAYGLPPANVVRRIIGSFNPGFNNTQLEATLDIDAVSAAAPDAEIDLFLIGGGASDQTAELALVNSQFGFIPLASDSFVACEAGTYHPSTQQIFDQAVAEGIAFFNSTGDAGGGECGPGGGIECPSCYPGVTSVGGTQFTAPVFDPTTGVLVSFQSEDGWAETSFASGGGVSNLVPIPAYQLNAQGFTGGVPAGSMRTVPDVAAMAGAPYTFIFVNGAQQIGGGTSFSAPLWAGIMALVDQFSGANQGSPNSAIYQYGIDQYKNGGTQTFRDIINGNTFLGGGSFNCCAAAFGYDLATGWGTPNVGVLALNYPTVKPSNVVAIANSATSITVTWAGSAGTFTIKRLANINGPASTIATGISGLTFTDSTSAGTGFQTGNTYFYQVQALSPGGIASSFSPLTTNCFATAYPMGISPSLASGQKILVSQINSIIAATNILLAATNEQSLHLNPIASGAPVQAADLLQIEQALSAAYRVIGGQASFSGPSIGGPVKAKDFTTVASGTKAAF